MKTSGEARATHQSGEGSLEAGVFCLLVPHEGAQEGPGQQGAPSWSTGAAGGEGAHSSSLSQALSTALTAACAEPVTKAC